MKNVMSSQLFLCQDILGNAFLFFFIIHDTQFATETKTVTFIIIIIILLFTLV